ncbi:hypothetical protein [Massilia horti]|uniref:Uncharacterized protein n=1 Tax=Massilia horti TaxID=2562153 RepID=A0A4Y9SKY6_9BURK|nr:hypothetical protein [Massilia horti]TFW27345.1 hypothetical protein E4O92_24480 [Massilia horti]
MNPAKPLAAVLLVLAGLAAALAQDEQGTAKPTPVAPADSATTVEQAAKPPQQRKSPPRRRSVQQIVGPEPRVSAEPPPALTYGPAPSGFPGAPPTSPAPVTPAPVPLNSCNGNFCTDANGGTYNAGVGGAAVNSQGKLCNRVGNTMQCF